MVDKPAPHPNLQLSHDTAELLLRVADLLIDLAAKEEERDRQRIATLEREEALERRREANLARLEQLQEMSVEILQATSRALLRRSIEDQLRVEEAKKRRSERFYQGHPGIPAATLEGSIQ